MKVLRPEYLSDKLPEETLEQGQEHISDNMLPHNMLNKMISYNIQHNIQHDIAEKGLNRALDKEVTGLYICDLLSWVMSHANKGDAWVTVQTHLNIVAVSILLEIPCIIVPEGIKVEEATIKKADEEGISILSTEMSGYEISWRVHEILC